MYKNQSLWYELQENKMKLWYRVHDHIGFNNT